MKDFAAVREASGNENVILFRGLAVAGGVVAGAAAALVLGLKLAALSAAGLVVGPTALGLAAPGQVAAALVTLLGALAGGGAGYWLWLLLAQLQGQIGAVPATAALRRAAAPFILFLPLIPALVGGRPEALWPAALWAGFAVGTLWLAFLERGDKRKIFFAHPTESDYHPGALFTHGAVIALGTGLGWYLQSLPQGAPGLAWGLWFPLGVGLGVWLVVMGLASLLGFLYTKHTFNQAFHAVALAALPLALLPLQSASWVGYAGLKGGGYAFGFLTWLLPVLAGVSGFGVFILVLLRLSRRPVEGQPAWEELFKAMMLIVAVPLLLFGAAFSPAGGPLGRSALAGAVDAFREGEPLASAQAMLMGRLPFKEILFRHGFLSDAMTGLTAMGWFGPGVEGLRLLLTWLAPLGLVAFYLLGIFCLPWIWALLLSLLVMTGNLGLIGETRFLFAYAGFIFTLLYLQGGRWPVLLFSGLTTVLALIASYTAGVIALGGHLILLLTFLALGAGEAKKRLLGLGVYAGALLVGLLPWFIYLGLSGSLGAFFGNFGWVLGQYQAIFGAALPGWGDNPGPIRILLFALPPLAVCFGVMTLVSALGKVKERGLPWNVLLLTALTGAFWLRFLQRGRFDFLLEALPVAFMLLAFALYRQTNHNPRLRGAVFTAAALLLFLPRAGVTDLTGVLGGFGLKNLVPAAGGVQATLPTLGKTVLPEAQAQSLAALAAFIDGQVGSAESFYDFSNQPLLYALVPRRPVVRGLSAVTLATFEQQVEAIKALHDAKIKAVIYPATAALAVEGVPSEVRQYALSEYLLQEFMPAVVRGDSVVLTPREENPTPDAAALAALLRPVDVAGLALAWGRLGKYDASQGGAAGVMAPADGVKSVEPAGLTVTASGDELQIAPAAAPVALRLTLKPDAALTANVLSLTLSVPAELDGRSAVLAWGDPAGGRSVAFRLRGDGAAHAYVVRVGALPSWVLGGPVTALRLTLPGGGWTWNGARLLSVRDLPDFVRAKAAAPAAPAPAEKAKSGSGAAAK